MSVVALRLLHLRELCRWEPMRPPRGRAWTGLELRVLGMELRRSLETVEDVLLAVDRLGGHMNRKSDGMPGWLTLWRGDEPAAGPNAQHRLMREIASGDGHPDGPP